MALCLTIFLQDEEFERFANKLRNCDEEGLKVSLSYLCSQACPAFHSLRNSTASNRKVRQAWEQSQVYFCHAPSISLLLHI